MVVVVVAAGLVVVAAASWWALWTQRTARIPLRAQARSLTSYGDGGEVQGSTGCDARE